ncbi:MAG TPA: RusA family crossover junction endodeoxyribonuclease [Bacteroidia bacterium]|nr:RusA family crossover junction endodeoxyribonuclease [Bacteroidia bacterium]
MIILKLPIPPSINKYYGTKNDKSKFLLDEVKLFRWETLIEVKKLKIKPLNGSVQLRILFVFKDKRKHDVDNRIKSLQDALQIAGLFADDVQVNNSNLAKMYKKSDKSYVLVRVDNSQNIINEDWIND